MDALDVGIFRETSHPRANFQWNFRESYRGLAETLGVDEETVRLRVKRLQEQGVLRGFELVLNPSVLGRIMLRVDHLALAPERKAALLEQAPLIEGMRWIFDHYEGGMGTVLFCEPSDVPRTVALLDAMAGAKSECWSLPTPPVQAQPTPLDWRILRALRRDPRRPYGEIAEELGVSAKTIKRRVERLSEARVCFLSGVVDFSRLRGAIAAEIIVHHAPGADPTAVESFIRGLDNRVFERCTPQVSAASVVAFSMSELDELRRQLAAVPGAERGRVHVLLRRITVDTWLDARIEQEASRAPAERDPPRVAGA